MVLSTITLVEKGNVSRSYPLHFQTLNVYLTLCKINLLSKWTQI